MTLTTTGKTSAAAADYLKAVNEKNANKSSKGFDSGEFGDVVTDKLNSLLQKPSTELESRDRSRKSPVKEQQEEEDQPEKEQEEDQQEEEPEDQMPVDEIPNPPKKKTPPTRKFKHLLTKRLKKGKWFDKLGNPSWYGKDGLQYYYDNKLKRKWRVDPINDRWTWLASDGLYHYMLHGDETWIGNDGLEHWYDKHGSEQYAKKLKSKKPRTVFVTTNGKTVEPSSDGHYYIGRGGRRQTKKSHSRKPKKKSRRSRKK
jgi:DNA mismatch repair ATPase MutL